MKHLVPPEQPSESMLVGCLLAASGGFQDAYTYNLSLIHISEPTRPY